MRTVEMLMEYEPGSYVERINPTPLLMIIAAGDHLAVADEAFATYNRALEPKKLVILPGGHFVAYVGPGFQIASQAACDWFVKHLKDVEQRALKGTYRAYGCIGASPRAGTKGGIRSERSPCVLTSLRHYPRSCATFCSTSMPISRARLPPRIFFLA